MLSKFSHARFLLVALAVTFVLPSARADNPALNPPPDGPAAFSNCSGSSDCSRYMGFLLENKKFGLGQNVNAFLGIQYATANRWEAPKPAKLPEENPIYARSFGPACPQLGKKGVLNEQCLYLNVWAPENAKNLPVMVFIHGGAFLSGSGDLPLYNGARTAGWKNVVVVTLNYRLGILGFLHNDPLTNGNYGIMDQELALKWVNSHIAKFGGDPKQVTLVGESAGSMSVSIHLLNEDKTVQSLFQGGIVESPYYGIPSFNDKEALLTAATAKFVAGKICKAANRGNDNEPCQPKTMDVHYLMQTQEYIQGASMLTTLRPFPFAPYVGKLPPFKQQLLTGKIKKPAIIGNNEYESTLFIDNVISKNLLGRTYSYERLVNFLTAPGIAELPAFKSIDRYNPDKMEADEKTGRLAKLMGDNALAKKIMALRNVMNDASFFCATRHVLNNSYQAGNSRLYSYSFNQDSSYNMAPIPSCDDEACHGYELPYVFDNTDVTFRSNEQLLSEQMQSYWTHFFTDLAPGTVDGGAWGSYLSKEQTVGRRYILQSGMKNSYELDQVSQCDFWEQNLYNKTAQSDAWVKEIEQAGEDSEDQIEQGLKQGRWFNLFRKAR